MSPRGEARFDQVGSSKRDIVDGSVILGLGLASLKILLVWVIVIRKR